MKKNKSKYTIKEINEYLKTAETIFIGQLSPTDKEIAENRSEMLDAILSGKTKIPAWFFNNHKK